MRVACLYTTEFYKSGSGQKIPHWKAINYVERSTDRAWIKVTGDGVNYGFVDIGLIMVLVRAQYRCTERGRIKKSRRV